MTNRQLRIGGRAFDAPDFANTLVEGWTVADGVVYREGRHDVQQWSEAAIARYRRDRAMYPIRLAIHRLARLAIRRRGCMLARPMSQRVVVRANVTDTVSLRGLSGCLFVDNVIDTVS